MSRDIDTKVIGYFSYKSQTEVTCEGDACIISGSENAMLDYLLSISKEAHDTSIIKKTRFGEIIQGLKRGAPYAFDEESYKRFYPLANRIGYNLNEEEFTPTETGRHFVVIRP